MSEEEWLRCIDVERMLESVKGPLSERQLRLFACACCRRGSHLITGDELRRALELSEQLDEHPDFRPEWSQLCDTIREPFNFGMDPAEWQCDADGLLGVDIDAYGPASANFAAILAVHVAMAKDPFALASRAAGEVVTEVTREKCPLAEMKLEDFEHVESLRIVRQRIQGARQAESQAQAEVLRDICNPFRSVEIDRTSCSSTALSVAQAIFNDYAFDRMAILADALEEAGCTETDILNHCRQPGVHVRGCWVVDLLLGKE